MNRIAANRAGLALGLLASLFAQPAPAHPPQFKEDHDRTLVVRLLPAAVVVTYRLEVDETQLLRDMAESDALGRIPPDSARYYPTVMRELAVRLANGLVARLDGQPLPDFTCVRSRHLVRDGYVSADFLFRAPWSPAPGARHTVTFREGNYAEDDASRLSLSLAAGDRVALRGVTAPDPALIARPGRERTHGDAERLRKLSATFVLADEVAKAAYKPALPPDPDPVRSPPRRRFKAASSLPPPAHSPGFARRPPGRGVTPGRARPESAAAEDEPFAEAGPPPGPATPRSRTLLHLLLDTRQGFVVLLLLAAGFGAAHALTPGHGKTLVAAYLVGERGTVGHAFFLGLVVTLTHTGAVLVVAAVLPLFFPKAPPATVETVLGLVGGLLVAGLGFWLLLCRVSGRADHIHLGGGHHHHPHGHDHHHGHDHVHGPGGEVIAVPVDGPVWWRLVVLGVSGGIVPCWDAILMLGVAVSAHRLWLGLPLLLAFSAGLAGVLIAIGIGVVCAGKYARQRWGRADRFRRVFRALPIISAVLITLLGLWLCYESVHAGQGEAPPSQHVRNQVPE